MDEAVRPAAGDRTFLGGSSEMARLTRDHDWAATPLGPIESWPPHLRTAVGIMLHSPEPVSLLWGPERIQLYNDAYIPVAADRHPASLGKPAAENWGEAYHAFLKPVFDRVVAGEAVTIRDQQIHVPRPDGSGTEERYFTASFSPIHDAEGSVAGIFHPVTETTRRILAERRLRQTEVRLGDVLDGMDEAFGLLDREFRILTFNDAALRMETRPIEAFLGRSHWEAYPGSETSELGRLLKRALVEQRPLTLEHLYTWQDGTSRWLDIRAYPVPEGLAVFWRDISQRKAAEGELRESEARFRLMADAVPQIVWITDPEGRAEFFNKQWFDYTGAPHEPTTAARVAAEVLHPDDAEPTTRAFDEARRTGGTFLIEHRIRSKAGDYRWFLVRGEPYRDLGTGEITRWFGASVDIHDRKRTEAALRELNETLEARVAQTVAERQVLADIVESSSAATMALDLAYNILAINQANVAAIERVYGKRPRAGDNLLDLLADMPEHQQQVRETWGRALAGEEFVVVDKFGDARHERVTFEVRFSVLRDREGQRIGATHTAFDISERVRAVAALAEAQEQLRQSQKMEAMGSLTGGVAHDFNNLLTPIIASLDMLLSRGVGSERERRLMDGALQSAERARVLVQRLLAFARRQPLQPGPVDVRRLVADMADLIASTSGPRVDVRVDLPPDLPLALADANQLEMALLNLAVNARDAMPEGGVLSISVQQAKVRTGRRTKLHPGDYVRLSVSDTGTGMDEDTLARAVEPFFSTKGVGRGTGLGLSMVHGLASQLGGGLTIGSRPGEGTTVELWLPVSTAPVEEDGQAPRPVAKAQSYGTALLVDDEDLVRMSTAHMLMDLGYEVVEARSAEEALHRVDEGLAPDLVVTDHLMPGLSGLDLARELHSRQPDLPVLIVSGYAEVGGIVPGFPRLAKPFRAAELAASLAGLRPVGASQRSSGTGHS